MSIRTLTALFLMGLLALGLMAGCEEEEEAQPQLAINAGQFDFSHLGATATLEISNAAGDGGLVDSRGTPLDWTITSSVAWLLASPSSGTSYGEADEVTVSVVGNPGAGLHEGTLTVTSNGGDATVAIVLNLAAVPLSPSPGDGATSASLTPTLTWSSGAVDSFVVHMDTSNPPTTRVGGGFATPMLVSNALQPGTEYFWRVTAYNGGEETVGDVWSFVTGGIAVLTSPIDGAVDVERNVAFMWTATFADSFDVLVDETDPPTAVRASGVTETTADVVLNGGRTYYWAVRTYTTSGDTTTTDSASFTTVPPEYELVSHQHFQARPSYLNLLYTVTDPEGWGVPGLDVDDFEISEDDREIAPEESFMYIRPANILDYSLRTVLAIDRSLSIGTDGMNTVKAAARNMVDAIGPNQEFAIISFSEDVREESPMTGNVQDLRNAIDGIEVDFPTTDLYGACIRAVDYWTDSASQAGIDVGVLVLLTDGQDTSGRWPVSAVRDSLDSRRVYTIGVGGETNEAILSSLAHPASAYVPLQSLSDADAALQEIQLKIRSFVDGFYWLRYLSPVRGAGTPAATLRYRDNAGTGPNSYIEIAFDSADHYSLLPGVYVNLDLDPDGIDAANMTVGNPMTFAPTTVTGSEPDFVWTTDHPSISFGPSNADLWAVEATASSASPGTATITVEDQANGYSKTITVTIN